VIRRLLRSVILGGIIGLGRGLAQRFTAAGNDLALAIGLMVALVVGLAVHRWLSFRRERRS
jgi:hypothetical protein